MAKGGPMAMPRTAPAERCSNLPISQSTPKKATPPGRPVGCLAQLPSTTRTMYYRPSGVPIPGTRLLPNCPQNQVAAGAGAQSHWLRSETGVWGVVRLSST